MCLPGLNIHVTSRVAESVAEARSLTNLPPSRPRHRSQPFLPLKDVPLTPNLHSGEFTTSFTSASLDTLGEFCKTHSSADITTFAVLDERSIKDSTVLLVKWELWSDYIDPNAKSGLDDESNRQQYEGWQTLRVPFGNAADVMYGLEYLPVQEFNSTNQGFDENGVYTG